MKLELSKVCGLDVDAQTRCRHYHGPNDIIAIKMRCCGLYYSCKDCHAALANHPVEVWQKSEWAEKAILCGACGNELTIQQYLDSNFQCGFCQAHFNPGCKNHYHDYFAY